MSKTINKKIDVFINEKILEKQLTDVMSTSFGKYSKYIIQDRALPDVRDGLKPVQRRILYAMSQMGVNYNKPYKKSARIAGEVMGKYHPHGDSSIYDAMVRMSQDFKMRHILVDMHGNNGSIDGDSAAAMRYTEARLSYMAEMLLADIDKKTVKFIPNFDDEEIEPTVLPAKFPNLLVNGAAGISAGYATKIPPHNLGEIIDATIHLIDNPFATFQDLADIIKGPDFPTGGIVYGKDGILQALETGSGKVTIRAKTQVEEVSKTQDRIVIDQIPFEVNKAELIKSIDVLRINNNIDDILEIRDETDIEGLRIVIDIKKGANPATILNYLFKNTNLQSTFNYNMVSIMHGRPVLSGVVEMLNAYITHQMEVITNRSNFELEKANKRLHIVEGLIKMVSVVDEVIRIIRASENKTDSKNNIMQKFGFTDLQAEAIVMLQLYRLSNTDILALEKESSNLEESVKKLKRILSNEKVLMEVIKTELLTTKNSIECPRLSQIEDEVETIKINPKELISEEKVVVGITKGGYIKRASLRSFTTSKAVGLKEDDCFIFEREISTLDTLLIFLSKGHYAFIPVHTIDEMKWGDLGIFINNLATLSAKDEVIKKVFVVKNFESEANFLLASKNGMMKQIKLTDLLATRYNKAIKVMKLDDNDELVSVDKNQRSHIVSLSKNGYSLRFKTTELPLYGLSAGGVKSMVLNAGDEVAAAIYINEDEDFYFFTSRNHVIKEHPAAIPVYARARKGVMLLERQKANPHLIVGASRLTEHQVKEDVMVVLATSKTHKITTVSGLRYSGAKFGKKIFEDADGVGYFFEIIPDINEEYYTPTKKIYKPIVNQTHTKEDIIVEEAIMKGDQQIRISRLDLDFDE